MHLQESRLDEERTIYLILDLLDPSVWAITLIWVEAQFVLGSVDVGGVEGDMYRGEFTRKPCQRPSSSPYVAPRGWIKRHSLLERHTLLDDGF